MHNLRMTDHVRDILLSKRREIDLMIADLTIAPDTTGGMAYGNRGDRARLAVERHSQAATFEKLHRRSAEIDRSLVKLAEGTYGVCDACKSPIPDERLEIHPWAVLCVPCAVDQ